MLRWSKQILVSHKVILTGWLRMNIQEKFDARETACQSNNEASQDVETDTYCWNG